MNFQITLTGFVALYILMLAGFTGWVIIGRVPAILHTPLMSGSNFVHGIVVVGGLFALLNASTVSQQVLGFVAVLLGAGNGIGVAERVDFVSRWFHFLQRKPFEPHVRHLQFYHPDDGCGQPDGKCDL